MPNFKLLYGNAADELRNLPDSSIDAVVTDPPYGLSREPDIAKVLGKWLAGEDYAHGGGGFMGKSWDSFVPGPNLWREVVRVLKPGGHALVFAGTRTQDLMGMSLRLAGFEVRDCLTWHYGTGFPKSLDVSKAIDKAPDKRRDEDLASSAAVARWLVGQMETRGISRREVSDHFGAANIAQRWTTCWTVGVVKPRVPSWVLWEELKRWLDLPEDMDEEVRRLNGRKGVPGDAWFDREVIGTRVSGIVTDPEKGPCYTIGGHSKEFDVTASATDAARKWEGWGTALKPASEPILLVRKPLDGTVAANVAEHGTGALNIDACRIGSEQRVNAACATQDGSPSLGGGRTSAEPTQARGRWPANMLLSHAPGCDTVCADSCPVAELDRQSGGASRFFYVGKPSKKERNYGCGGLKETTGNRTMGTDSREYPTPVNRNTHPTVKPVALMRQLVRLITPPGGTVLDPFIGSGTTALAAAIEGFDSIGCEMSGEYLPIIEARMGGWRRGDLSILTADEARAATAPPPADDGRLPL